MSGSHFSLTGKNIGGGDKSAWFTYTSSSYTPVNAERRTYYKADGSPVQVNVLIADSKYSPSKFEFRINMQTYTKKETDVTIAYTPVTSTLSTWGKKI